MAHYLPLMGLRDSKIFLAAAAPLMGTMLRCFVINFEMYALHHTTFNKLVCDGTLSTNIASGLHLPNTDTVDHSVMVGKNEKFNNLILTNSDFESIPHSLCFILEEARILS